MTKTNDRRLVKGGAERRHSRAVRLALLSGTCLAFQAIAQGQLSPVPRTLRNSIRAPLVIESGDLDGDGDMDLVAAAWTGIYWFENLGGLGRFQQAHAVSGFQGTPDVLVADMDGDGDPDLVSFDALDGVTWHENEDGQGSFGLGAWIGPVTLGVTDVDAADLDSDGDPDLVCAWVASDDVSWFENDGQGNFGSAQPIVSLEPYSSPRDVASADLDGDGDLDVIVFWEGRVVWYENVDGLGALVERYPGIAGWLCSCNSPRDAILASDLDGDGDLDVLIGTGVVQWHENLDGLGSFGPGKLVGQGEGVQATDIDLDGDVDVVAYWYQGSGYLPLCEGVWWHENLGGAFAQHTLADGCSRLFAFADAHVVDLDGDGDPEVLMSTAGGNLQWYENYTRWTTGFPRIRLGPSWQVEEP